MISDKKVKGTDLRVCFPLEDTQNMLGPFSTYTTEVGAVGEKEALQLSVTSSYSPPRPADGQGLRCCLQQAYLHMETAFYYLINNYLSDNNFKC